MRKKITVVGAGNVGATCAQRLVEKAYADIVLLDIVEGLPQGKALDMVQSGPVINFNSSITGTNDYALTADSSVVVITSGLARKPGMTRDQLLAANAKIVGEVIENIITYSPKCIIINVTNPVDAMTYLALYASKFPPNRVFGLSGVLDGARLRSFIAAELKTAVGDISVCVLGEHGTHMVVIPRLCLVNGVPITKLLPHETVNQLIERTINGGAEIVGLLKTGSAFYAPSAAVTQMVDAVMLDNKQILSCSVLLNGQYGMRDTVINVPVKLGENGIEQIIELDLTPQEKQALSGSAQAVKQQIEILKLNQ